MLKILLLKLGVLVDICTKENTSTNARKKNEVTAYKRFAASSSSDILSPALSPLGSAISLAKRSCDVYN